MLQTAELLFVQELIHHRCWVGRFGRQLFEFVRLLWLSGRRNSHLCTYIRNQSLDAGLGVNTGLDRVEHVRTGVRHDAAVILGSVPSLIECLVFSHIFEFQLQFRFTRLYRRKFLAYNLLTTANDMKLVFLSHWNFSLLAGCLATGTCSTIS